jgi:hypothetical protein
MSKPKMTHVNRRLTEEERARHAETRAWQRADSTGSRRRRGATGPKDAAPTYEAPRHAALLGLLPRLACQ